MPAPPAKFLPANATATGLIFADGTAYTATVNKCGDAPEAVWAMDYMADDKPVVSWPTGGATVSGIALGTDGTVYASTGKGTSQYAGSVVALEPKTLKLKDWVSVPGVAFNSLPVLFTEGNKTYVAATADNGRLYLFDAASLGGADHRMPLFATPAASNRTFAKDGLATWRDAAGTRWVLAATSGAIAAFKLAAGTAAPSLEQAWVSRALVEPRAPTIINDVVFALSGGRAGGPNAVLYALDPATGKDLWNSGSTITSYASAGLSAGTGQVYAVTYDNTVWAFGIPQVY